MLWVAYAARRPSQAILEALGGLYMQDCRYELRRIPLLRTWVNSRAGSSTDSYATTCPTSGRLLNASRRSVRLGVYRLSGRSVRTASTTCSIAALVTLESPLSYNSDS